MYAIAEGQCQENAIAEGQCQKMRLPRAMPKNSQGAPRTAIAYSVSQYRSQRGAEHSWLGQRTGTDNINAFPSPALSGGRKGARPHSCS